MGERLTGTWSVMDEPWFEGFAQMIEGSGGAWFIIQIIFGGFMVWVLYHSQRARKRRSMGTIAVVINEQHRVVDGNHIVKLRWKENKPGAWGGYAPMIEI